MSMYREKTGWGSFGAYVLATALIVAPSQVANVVVVVAQRLHGAAVEGAADTFEARHRIAHRASK